MKDSTKDTVEGFKKWAESNTATFGFNGEDDYNISWDELSFYDDLILKIEELITSERTRCRESVSYESILPTWIDEEPAWTLVVVKDNHVVWVSEKPVKKSIIASAYYQETGNYAMPVITIGEMALGTKHIYEQTLTTNTEVK